MQNNENNALWIQMFNEQVSEKGINFPSEESKAEALADFISQCENNADNPEIHVPQVAAEAAKEEAPAKKQRTKKEPVKKEYKPEYSDEKKAELELVTKIAIEQIESVKNDQSIPTYNFGDNNCVIDIIARCCSYR